MPDNIKEILLGWLVISNSKYIQKYVHYIKSKCVYMTVNNEYEKI